MEPPEVDSILRSLAATMEHQRSINADLRTFARQQLAITDRLTAVQEQQALTLARIAVLLARWPRQEPNGRDA